MSRDREDYVVGKTYKRYRIGIVVVDNDPVPEMEIWQLAPPGVSIHTVRFHLPRSPGQEFTGSSESPRLTRALEVLERIGVDAVALCFTSGSIFDPLNFDKHFTQAAYALNPSWKVATAAQAIISSMRRAGARYPYVVIPPWFTGPTVDALLVYLENNGLEVQGYHLYKLPPVWDTFPAQDRFDRGAKWVISPHELIIDLNKRDLSGADSILVPGSGFPSLDLLHKVRVQPSLPMFSANSCVLDELLHLNTLEI